jgi:HK97 gp10 family phage protein
MPTNVSVERFKRLTQELKIQVHQTAVIELNKQAQDLAQTIAAVAPVAAGITAEGVVSGALKHSVRVIPDRNKDTIVRVAAGGELTTRPSVSTRPYDYARADEFGTQKMAPHPFFFPTYRLLRKRMVAAMRRKITANIKKVSAA